jgi:hypothetical protein
MYGVTALNCHGVQSMSTEESRGPPVAGPERHAIQRQAAGNGSLVGLTSELADGPKATSCLRIARPFSAISGSSKRGIGHARVESAGSVSPSFGCSVLRASSDRVIWRFQRWCYLCHSGRWTVRMGGSCQCDRTIARKDDVTDQQWSPVVKSPIPNPVSWLQTNAYAISISLRYVRPIHMHTSLSQAVRSLSVCHRLCT